MAQFESSQIFAALKSRSQSKSDQNNSKKISQEEVFPARTPPTRSNEIQVSATAELSLPPDKCRITIFVSSKKDNVQEAKNSVSRRLEYILQVLNNYHIKEEDINICKVLKRDGSAYVYDNEITVTFNDATKCQGIINFLVEKLDHNVQVSSPEFFQSSQRLDSLRRQTAITAVRNAKVKAAEIAQYLSARVGQPISIREDFCNEVDGPSSGTEIHDGAMTIQNRMALASVTVTVKVTASFELKHKSKGKQSA